MTTLMRLRACLDVSFVHYLGASIPLVVYDFNSVAPSVSFSRLVFPIIVTIYVVFFIFFRLGTYSSEQAQIAGSTKPLTAQRRRFLHRYYRYYRFHSRYHQPLVIVTTCMARVKHQKSDTLIYSCLSFSIVFCTESMCFQIIMIITYNFFT